jgi:hypothetical protein
MNRELHPVDRMEHPVDTMEYPVHRMEHPVDGMEHSMHGMEHPTHGATDVSDGTTARACRVRLAVAVRQKSCAISQISAAVTVKQRIRRSVRRSGGWAAPQMGQRTEVGKQTC